MIPPWFTASLKYSSWRKNRKCPSRPLRAFNHETPATEPNSPPPRARLHAGGSDSRHGYRHGHFGGCFIFSQPGHESSGATAGGIRSRRGGAARDGSPDAGSPTRLSSHAALV